MQSRENQKHLSLETFVTRTIHVIINRKNSHSAAWYVRGRATLHKGTEVPVPAPLYTPVNLTESARHITYPISKDRHGYDWSSFGMICPLTL